MQLFKLDSSYLPSTTIRNFDTLAWTERYQLAGDFKLEIENEVSVLTTLPLGTLISHTDTTEVMIVENHEIDRGTGKFLKVTISGRSFETFAENRITAGLTLTLKASATAVKEILELVLDPDIASAENEIPNLSVYSDMRVLDATMTHIIKDGSAYTSILELLRIADTGIKTIRPNGAQTTLDLVVHDGEDRIATIIFYALNEDLNDAKYFWSIKGSKNYVYILYNDAASSRIYRHRDLGSDLNGLQRRLLYVEANDIIGAYSPPVADDPVSARAQAALDEHRTTSLISAKISNTARPKFKFDYDVGDIVTVFGDFGVAQTMRVSEHILTVDKDGIRGYPSLTIL